MSYNYIVNHIGKMIRGVKNTKRPSNPMDWEYITIHNTGNPNSNALGERAWLDNPKNTDSTGYHIVIDEFRAIECIPLNENALHAGDGRDGVGNRKSVGVEICESGNYAQTIKNAIDLTARLLYKKNKGVEFVVQHNRWSGKNCPRLLRQGNNWNLFINAIDSKLNDLKRENEIKKPIEPNKKEEIKVSEKTASWKVDILKKLHDDGIVLDFDGWVKKLDDTAPIWLVMALMNNLNNKLKEKESGK